MKFFKLVKKFMSRKMAVSKLLVTTKQFEKLCVLCSIYPVIANQRNCIDKENDFYYTIEDIQYIYQSEAFENMKINNSRDKKRKEFKDKGLIKRSNSVKNIEMKLIPLIKKKYASFGDSLVNMGNTLKTLYYLQLFNIVDVNDVLIDFENFIKSQYLLEKAFLAKKGIYYKFTVQNVSVIWMVPYPGDNLQNLVEDKKEIAKEIRFTNAELFDIGVSQESLEVLDDTTDKIDSSLIKYAAPLLKMHIKLLLHKLNTMKEIKPNQQIFKNYKFNIQVKSIYKQIEFIIDSTGGEIEEYENANFIIAENYDLPDENKLYLQPQFLFDCLNEGRVLDVNIYRMGKVLPTHKSPFPSIFDKIDNEILDTLSNRKKYMLLDKIEYLE